MYRNVETQQLLIEGNGFVARWGVRTNSKVAMETAQGDRKVGRYWESALVKDV